MSTMGFRGNTSKPAVLLGPPRCVSVFILTLTAVFIATQLQVFPVAHFRNGAEWAIQSVSDFTTLEPSSPTFEIPTSLAPLIQQLHGPRPLFTVPALQTYYQDLLPNNYTKLYLVTAGIMMSVSLRNLSAVACMVGDDVYPASIFTGEVLHCEIPRHLRPGERLVPVLAWDDVLKRAVKGPVTLSTGVVAEISHGDITKLPQSAILRGNLSSSNPDDFRLARSEVTIGPSDKFVAKNAKFSPRYRLCLMTMIAPNSHMLKDWADYHRRIGVDQVYIFDNGAERDLRKMFEGRVDVEIINWPYHKSQRQAVSQFLFAARARCERVQLEDSDEYPMFGLGQGLNWRKGDPPLIRYVKRAEEHGFDNLKLLHLVMANSGFVRRPKGEVPTNFIHRRLRQTFQNGKSICKSDLEWENGAIHQCGEVNGKNVRAYYNDIHSWGELKMEPEYPEDPPFLVHYKDRSWEEYIEKWDAGRVAGKLVADEVAGTMNIDEPTEKYMHVDPELEYTHFRDKIYHRVLREGTLNEQTLVQIKDDMRCETLYDISNNERKLVREVCA